MEPHSQMHVLHIITTFTVICNVYPSIYNVAFPHPSPWTCLVCLFFLLFLWLVLCTPNPPKTVNFNVPLFLVTKAETETNMGRSPCCEKVGLKKGPWTPEEDQKLMAYIEEFGHGSWRALPAKAGNIPLLHNI